MNKIIRTDKAPAPIGPYNQAVWAKGILYVSGQIAINPSSGVVESHDIRQETHLVLKNLTEIVTAAGLTLEHVVKTTIFIRDMNQFQVINEIYGEYFQNNFPARETVEVSRLPKDVNIEISCIAASEQKNS